MKFILGIRNLDLQFRVVEYRANPTPSLYGAYKQAESTLLVLQTQAQLQESREQRQGYEAFRSFQASVGNDHRPRPSYNSSQRQPQSVQLNLPYRESRKVERNNSYTNRDQDPHTSARNMYTPQDARAQEFSQNRISGPALFNAATSRNPFVNGSAQYIYQWGNPLCYKCGTLGHTSPECNSNTPLSRAESSHLRNLYQRPPPNREFDFPIPAQAHNGRELAKDHQRPNHNSGITQSNFVTAEPMRPRTKRSTRVVEYNGDSDSDGDDEDAEFVDVDLPCNKLSLQLLANDSITRTKKRRVIETDDEDNEPLKPKATREKRKPVKRVGKKSTKASVPIAGLVGQAPPDIQALLMNTNIVIPALHLFQISPKFREETRRLMTVPRKPRKKKVVPPAVPIIEEEEELYAEVHHPNQDTVDTNHALLQTPKQELAEILQSKGEAFRMKATIWKSDKDTKYALPDFYVKAD